MGSCTAIRKLPAPHLTGLDLHDIRRIAGAVQTGLSSRIEPCLMLLRSRKLAGLYCDASCNARNRQPNTAMVETTRHATRIPPIPSDNSCYRVVFWLTVATLTTAACRFYVSNITWDQPYAALTALMDGTAHRPFVFRVLLPALTKLVTLTLGIDPISATTALIYLAMLGTVAGLRWFASVFWAPSLAFDVAALLVPVTLLPLTLGFHHVYDMPTLCLFTWGLAALAHRRWRILLLIYALGSLSKETMLFLSIVYAVWYARVLDLRSFWKLLLMQGGIYLMIRVMLLWHFRANPGEVVQYNLINHLVIYTQLPGFTTGYGIVLALIAMACAWGWHSKPQALRHAALALVATITPLYLLFGFPFELRVFYEAFAPVYLLALPLARRPALADTLSASPSATRLPSSPRSRESG